jgi:hypothetical protein
MSREIIQKFAGMGLLVHYSIFIGIKKMVDPYKQFLLSFNITIRKPAVILHCVVKNDHHEEAPNRRIITTIGSC